jgi:hypothetical protein
VTDDELHALLPRLSAGQLRALRKALGQEERRREVEGRAIEAERFAEFIDRARTFSLNLRPNQNADLVRFAKLLRPVSFTEHGGEISPNGPLGVFRSLAAMWKSLSPRWGEVEEHSFAWWLDAWVQQEDQRRNAEKQAAKAAAEEMWRDYEERRAS